MAGRKRHTAEQIIGMLRATEVAVAQGRTVAETCREHAISEQTCYRWRTDFGGLKLDQAKRLKELERENQRHVRMVPADADALTGAIVRLASQYGRYGYRRITALPHQEGWRVNHKRVERIWRREGLKVPKKQPKRGRLWLNDGSCVPPAPELAVPCLGLRLRHRPHARRTELSHADDHRRVHPRVPGHRCRSPAHLGRRAAPAG